MTLSVQKNQLRQKWKILGIASKRSEERRVGKELRIKRNKSDREKEKEANQAEYKLWQLTDIFEIEEIRK